MKMEELMNTKQLHAYILIGLPGSGKSTWVEKLLASNSGNDFVVVSSDDILENIAKEKNLTYSDVYKEYIGIATSKMKENFRNALINKKNIVWDQTNMSKKKRKGILSELGNDYYKIAVDFSINPSILKKRLKDRAEKTGKHIPWSVIESMGSNYNPPSKEEGFDEIIRVSY